MIENEKAFRGEYFQGKEESNKLNADDAEFLINLGLPFIKKANASFIIRNMGGEAIKCDRWIEAFLSHYRISLESLMNYLEELGIETGFFDIVIWAYCNEYIKILTDFKQHFKESL